MGFFIGRTVPLSLSRRLVTDFMHLSRHVPRVSMERRMPLRPLVAARAASALRPSWYALLSKAFGIVAARNPMLRRTYMSYPWPRLYEHPESVATISVEREVRGESTPLVANISHPERRSLADVNDWVRRAQDRPLHENGGFRRLLFLSRLPFPVRRYIMWLCNEWSGSQRARFFGTFGISLTSSLGATLKHMVTPWTTTLHAGPFGAGDSMPLRVWFDHRLLDGAPMARILKELEEVLLGEILIELRSLPCREAARSRAATVRERFQPRSLTVAAREIRSCPFRPRRGRTAANLPTNSAESRR